MKCFLVVLFIFSSLLSTITNTEASKLPLGYSPVSSARVDSSVRPLPDSLRLGAATAAYQIEGAWNVSDKSPSIWDTFVHQDPSPVADGSTGDVAGNSYYFYKRDIEMLKFLGVDFYRFSVSWPRLLPNGFSNYISEDGKAYYNNLIDELIENGIEPVLTMYHWDLPQNLQDLGGWTNPLIVDWFEDYARVLFDLFGDRVKSWITINEPKQVCLFGYGIFFLAPGIKMEGTADYLCAKHVVLANARAWHLYNDEYRATQQGNCSITIASDYRTGLTQSEEDIEAGLDAMAFEVLDCELVKTFNDNKRLKQVIECASVIVVEVDLYAHPIFSTVGGFPDRVRRRVDEKSTSQGYPRSRLPEFTEDERLLAIGTSDFYGFNFYSTLFYYRNGSTDGIYTVPSYNDDLGAFYAVLDNVPNFEAVITSKVSEMLMLTPTGLRASLSYIKNHYDSPPIAIWENGWATDLGLADDDRVLCYKKSMEAVLDAIEEDGVNVIAYTAWSLMDNFEWSSGLEIRYGIFEVDYEDPERSRRPRKSAHLFRNIVATRTLDQEYEPQLPEDDLKF